MKSCSGADNAIKAPMGNLIFWVCWMSGASPWYFVYKVMKPQHVAGAEILLTIFPNNRQPPVLNGYRYRCVDGKPSLFKPGAFEEKERSDWIAAIGFALQSVVPVAFADFESAIFHGVAPIDDASKFAL